MALKILSDVIKTLPDILGTKDNFTNQNGGKNGNSMLFNYLINKMITCKTVFFLIFILKYCLGVHLNDGELVATGREAGTAAVATGVFALATIAMITEFIIYSGFSPKVKTVTF